MERQRELELALWREACRHIDIADSFPDLVRAIGAVIPLASMHLFVVEPPGVSLVASEPAASRSQRFSVTGEEAQQAIRFAAKGGLALFNPAQPGRSLVRRLAGAVGPGPAIFGALQRNGAPEGIVAWRLMNETELSDRVTRLLAATLEPLAAALDTSRRFHELEDLRRSAEADRQAALRRLGRESLSDPIVGADGGLRHVIDRVELVAAQDIPVLILGETGSGKEVVARSIHERSNRHDGPFVRVNCGAIPPDLIDSQLFGHEKAAFTGATDRRLGWFERADGGTLFLDEIGELPPAAQVRLLRVVQEGMLERVGGQEPVSVDCRIVAATHRDLAEMVRSRTFREDLWYRLAVFPIVLPPLRERGDDLPELVRHFASRAATRFGLPDFEVRDDDISILQRYDWPGNIRELAAVIDRAALLGRGHRLALETAMGTHTGHTSPPLRQQAQNGEKPVSLQEAIRAAIQTALDRSGGKIDGEGGAAELLDVNPSTLRSKMLKLGLNRGKT